MDQRSTPGGPVQPRSDGDCGDGPTDPCARQAAADEAFTLALGGLLVGGFLALEHDDVDDATRVTLTARGRAEVAS